MKILLVNDDGVFAPGIKVLEDLARQITDDIVIVAPSEEMSACGRMITVNRPLRLAQLEDHRWSVNGTPADCVMLALQDVLNSDPPDLVLSGVNIGQNLAEDTSQSGTVAGAFQAMQMGIPAIALSLAIYLDPDYKKPKWDTVKAHGPKLLEQLVNAGLSKDHVLNINFPDCVPDEVAGTKFTKQGRRDHLIAFVEDRSDLRGKPYHWIGFRGPKSVPKQDTDLHAIYEKFISVTPLSLDMTNHDALAKLSAQLS